MEVAVKIKRFNRESGSGPYYEDFKVECEEHEMVLDALIKIREYQDQSLALRCSCRSAICGSCAMRVNGHAGLACNTKITDALSRSDTIVVEPMGNTSVIKDLVVDAKPFWERINKIQPWLSPTGPTPDHEYIVDNSAMLALNQVMGCIMCGACVSDCTVLEVDKRFLGPAALAKALRFAGDPRDGIEEDRLRKLGQAGGIWDCTHCFECVQVCPKGVAPMDQILELRRKAVERASSTTTAPATPSPCPIPSSEVAGWMKSASSSSPTAFSTSAPLLDSSRQPSDLSNLGSCRPFSITSGPVRIK